MEQKNYLVAVDRKYLVTIQSTTNGGAEHRILDNIPLVKNCQAYSIEELTPYTLNGLETIRYEDLQNLKHHEQSEKMQDMNRLIDSKCSVEKELEEIEKEIEATQIELDRKKQEYAGFKQLWEDRKAEINRYSRENNIAVKYYKPDEINECWEY